MKIMTPSWLTVQKLTDDIHYNLVMNNENTCKAISEYYQLKNLEKRSRRHDF